MNTDNNCGHYHLDNIIDLYECSCCRSRICEKCLVNGEYLLCQSCHSNDNLTHEDMYTWLMKCEICGNLWDGNAQCNCWEYDFKLAFESESESEPELESEPEPELYSNNNKINLYHEK